MTILVFISLNFLILLLTRISRGSFLFIKAPIIKSLCSTDSISFKECTAISILFEIRFSSISLQNKFFPPISESFMS